MSKSQQSRHFTPCHFTPRRFTRRHFLQLLGGMVLAGGSFAGYTRLVEPRWLDVEQIVVPIPNLPTRLDGRRIAQLSDIHLSQYQGQEHLASALARVREQAPDWLMLTGDFVGRDAENAQGMVEPLRSIRSTGLPTFAIFGNHDLWTHRGTVHGYLKAAGVTTLLNDAEEIEAGLWLAGIDDLWSGHPDLSAAMSVVPSGATTLLLAHEPDFFDRVLQQEAPVALQLSGHSHGGQVRLPLLAPDATGRQTYAPILPRYGRRYPIGLRTINGRHVYTNRGLGVWPLPLRFNCRPELSIFTLRPA